MVFETCGLRTGVCILGIVSVCFLSHASLASHVCTAVVVAVVAFRFVSLHPGSNTASYCRSALLRLCLTRMVMLRQHQETPYSPAAGLEHAWRHVSSGDPCVRAADSDSTVLSPFASSSKPFLVE